MLPQTVSSCHLNKNTCSVPTKMSQKESVNQLVREYVCLSVYVSHCQPACVCPSRILHVPNLPTDLPAASSIFMYLLFLHTHTGNGIWPSSFLNGKQKWINKSWVMIRTCCYVNLMTFLYLVIVFSPSFPHIHLPLLVLLHIQTPLSLPLLLPPLPPIHTPQDRFGGETPTSRPVFSFFKAVQRTHYEINFGVQHWKYV